VLKVGTGMMRGAKPGELLKHVKELVDALTDEEISLASGHEDLQGAALEAMSVIVKAVQARGAAAFEGQFLATGRLETRAVVLRQMTKGLLLWHHHPRHQKHALETLCQLAECTHPAPSHAAVPTPSGSRSSLPSFLADHCEVLAEEVVASAAPHLSLPLLPTLADMVGQELLPFLLAHRVADEKDRARWLAAATSTLRTFSQYFTTATAASGTWDLGERAGWAKAWLASLSQCLASMGTWNSQMENELGLLPLLAGLSGSAIALGQMVVDEGEQNALENVGEERNCEGLDTVLDMLASICECATALGSALDRGLVRESLSSAVGGLTSLIHHMATQPRLAPSQRRRLVRVYAQVLLVGAMSSRVLPLSKQPSTPPLGWVALAMQAWRFLLARQEDPMEDIRMAAAKELRVCLHFTTVHSPTRQKDQPILSLETVVQDALGCLARHKVAGVDAGGGEEYTGVIDCLLREAAVLDPTAFRGTLDAEISGGRHSVDPDLHAGLVDHVELLSLLSRPVAE